VLLEYIQSHLFTGFGWTLLGYSQYKNLQLIQIADFSGVYGVSFVIMLVNVTVWRSMQSVTVHEVTKSPNENLRFRTGQAPCRQKRNKLSFLYLFLFTSLVVIFSYGYGIFRLSENKDESTVKISVIQGNIAQELKWDPDVAQDILDKYASLTKLAALTEPDLIVWPETSFPGFLVSDKEMTQELLDLVKEVETPLLLGANTEEMFETFNSAVLISDEGYIIDKYDKIHLVPFGEYVPFSRQFPGLGRLILGGLGEFTPGEEFKVFPLLEAKFATLICFEDIFPELAKRFVQNGADFLIVITNDAWYGKTPAAYQHAACSVFRAIENRVSVVRCANTGYSCFIDKRGRIYSSVEKDGTHLFVAGYKTSFLQI